MNTTDWWNIFNAKQSELRDLVACYHPTSGMRSDMPITAPGAEALCEEMRNKILAEARVSGLDRFDAAVQANDADTLCHLLSETWFGMPESANVRYEPGFDALCDLCEGVDDERSDVLDC